MDPTKTKFTLIPGEDFNNTDIEDQDSHSVGFKKQHLRDLNFWSVLPWLLTVSLGLLSLSLYLNPRLNRGAFESG